MLVGLGFVASNGEAKRKIAEGAVKVDGEAVSDPQALVNAPARVSLGQEEARVGYPLLSKPTAASRSNR